MAEVAGLDGRKIDLVGSFIGRQILDRVAEPVVVTGRVEALGDLVVIYIDPARVQRIGERS